MARHAVAEIDTPRQRRRVAVRVIVEAREEAADAADRDAGDQRQGECITTRTARADRALDEFDADKAAEQRADDRLAFEQMAPVGEIGERVARILDPVAKLR